MVLIKKASLSALPFCGKSRKSRYKLALINFRANHIMSCPHSQGKGAGYIASNIASVVHDLIKNPDHFVRRFVKTAFHPLIKQAEQPVGVKARLIAPSCIGDELRHHYLIKGVIDGGLHLRRVNHLNDAADFVIEPEEILRIFQGEPLAHGQVVFLRPAVPRCHKLEGESFALAVVIPEPSGTAYACGVRNFTDGYFFKGFLTHQPDQCVGKTFFQKLCCFCTASHKLHRSNDTVSANKSQIDSDPLNMTEKRSIM